MRNGNLLKQHRSGVAAVVLLASIGCAEDGARLRPLQLIEPPLRVTALTRTWRPAAGGDALGVRAIVDVRPFGDSLLALARSSQIVVFDAALEPSRVFDARDSAGRLLRPTDLAVHGAAIAIADGAARRAVFFTADGTPAGELPLRPLRGRSLGLLGSGALVVPVRSSSHYLEHVTDETWGVPWAARPAAADADGTLQPRGAPGFQKDFVAVTAGDTVHVLDGERAEFLKYAPDGRLVLRRMVPLHLRARVLDGTGTVSEVVGGRAMTTYRPAFSEFAALPDGRLLALLNRTSGRMAGFLIDPRDYSARRIVLAVDLERWRIPVAAAVLGTTLVVTSPGGELLQYEIGR